MGEVKVLFKLEVKRGSFILEEEKGVLGYKNRRLIAKEEKDTKKGDKTREGSRA